MIKINQCRSLLLIVFYIVHEIHAQDTVREDWNLNDIVNNIFSDDTSSSPNNKPISNALSELTKKASGEFDKLCHQLEGVLKQLTSNEPVKITQLGPNVVNKDCKCYCLCPQDTVNSKVIDDMKVKVMGLKERFIGVGRSIKEKIHELTAR